MSARAVVRRASLINQERAAKFDARALHGKALRVILLKEPAGRAR